MKGTKTGGRCSGTPNAITSDLRAKINAIIENQVDTIEDDLQALLPMQRLQIVEKLLSYCLPKLTSQNISVVLEQLTDMQLQQVIESINIQDDGTNE